MRRFCCALAALLLLPALAFAQRFEGRLLDPDGTPLAGATVTLHRAGALVAGAVADAEGRVRIAAPAPGTYTFTATYVGYTPLRFEVTLDAGTARRRPRAGGGGC